MSAVPTHSSDTLCLQCGLCCNGVLFADVKLQPADDPDRLKAGGVPVRKQGPSYRFAQPCAALQPDGKCCVYRDRPTMCRQFECGVLKEVQQGSLAEAEALRLIRRVQKLAARVTRLLEASGDHDAHRPLTKRYQSVMRQPIDLSGGDEAGDRRGELMLAVQQLMELVQQRFLRDAAAG